MRVTITWSFTDPGVTDIIIQGFIVERALQGGPFSPWQTLANPLARSVVDGTLTSGVTGQYRVKTYGTVSSVPMESTVSGTVSALNDRDAPLRGPRGPQGLQPVYR